ncbi:MAG: CBS domain-containing protein [Candidatus Woesearchaeota archaeon]
MKNKDVRELVVQEFEKGDVEDNVAKLIPKFHASRDVIILTDQKGYKGVLTQKQLNRTQLDIENTKAKTLMRTAPKISPKTTLGEAARLMLESNLYHLPVFENNKLIGVVKSSDLIEATIDIIADYRADEIMTKPLKTINEDKTLKHALILFRENAISRLAVTQEDKIIGMISLHDVVGQAITPIERPGFGQTFKKTTSLDVHVSSIMKKQVVTAKKEFIPREIFELMKQKDVSSIVISNKGIITRKDLLETISYEINKEEKDVFIQISSKVDFDRENILEEVKSFVVKNKSLGPGYIYVHVHKHKETHKNKPLIHIRLRVRCKDSFDVTSEGYGAEHAIREALRTLKVLLLKADKKPRASEIMEYLDIDAY